MPPSALAPIVEDDTHAPARPDPQAFHAALVRRGLVPGDRVCLALPPGRRFAEALLGARRAGLTVALAPPGDEGAAEAIDARLTIAGDATADAVRAPRSAHASPTPDAAYLVRTSGSTGTPRWIALSDANVRAVLASHDDALPPAGATVLSVLPWHHVFGLVLELLPALARAATIVRDRQGGRDADAMRSAAARHGATHLAAVPATIARVLEATGGRAWLHGLAGGLVGGAPVSAALAAALAGSPLRVGYGQTEASPGIALGEPGEWRPRLLGRARGCEVRIDDDGVLAFRGPNAALGEWRDGALVRLPADRWVRTGDVVRADGDILLFEGREGASFKLANGRWVDASRVEGALHARVAGLHEARLGTDDGDRLVLACTTHDGAPPPDEAVRAALGPLASLSWELRVVPASSWVRTPKGELDRRAPLPIAVR